LHGEQGVRVVFLSASSYALTAQQSYDFIRELPKLCDECKTFDG
jgi:hypothetical protein